MKEPDRLEACRTRCVGVAMTGLAMIPAPALPLRWPAGRQPLRVARRRRRVRAGFPDAAVQQCAPLQEAARFPAAADRSSANGPEFKFKPRELSRDVQGQPP